MPRNGTGTYTPPPSTWSPGVNGVTATTADFNSLLNDLSNGLTGSVSADGQTPLTGNFPLGNNRITGLAAGVAGTDAVNLTQARNLGLGFPNTGGVGIGTTVTLLASQVNQWFLFNANVQATLPALANVTTGNTFTFVGGALGGSVRASGADAITTPLAVSGATYAVGRGETVMFVANGAAWVAVLGGFGARSFANGLGGSGYQYWPASTASAGPLLEQWGTTTLVLNGSAGGAITYPVAFPTAPFSTVAMIADNNVLQSVNLINSQYTNSAFGFQVSGGIGAATVRIAWFARGN